MRHGAMIGGAPPPVFSSLTWGTANLGAPAPGNGNGDTLSVTVNFTGGVGPFTGTININGVDRISNTITSGGAISGHVLCGWSSGNAYVKITDALGLVVSSYPGIAYQTVNIYYAASSSASGGSCSSLTPTQGTFVSVTAGTPPGGNLPGDITYAWTYGPLNDPYARAVVLMGTGSSVAYTPTLNDLGATFFGVTGQSYALRGRASSATYPQVLWDMIPTFIVTSL